MDYALTDLAANVVNALRFSPPDYLRSITGRPSTWYAPGLPPTEIKALDPARPLETLNTLRQAVIPSWPGRPNWLPDGPVVDYLFRPSSVDQYPRHSLDAMTGEGESWMFLNGICTDMAVADINAASINALFGLPVLTQLHNQTHGAAIDLAECALGKGWLASTEAVWRLFPAFYSELLRPDISKVILLAHSQGTILTGVFLSLLKKLKGLPLADMPEARKAEAMLDRRAPTNKKLWVLEPGTGLKGANLRKVSQGPQELLWLDWKPGSALGLPPITEAQVRKLEVYCFATCATHMPYLFEGESPAPYIEHFGNARDLVARMGLFAPKTGPGRTEIAGLRFIRRRGWGHLLNAHYLNVLAEQWQQGREDGFFDPDNPARLSRLSGYHARALV